MRLLDRLVLRQRPREPEASVAERMEAAYDAGARGDYATALAIWEPLAQAGVARAQANIGACFAEGLGVDRDVALAARWMSLAAEAGDPVGQRNLASLYFKGEGVAQDYARAAELYRAAAEVGDAPAQDMLGWMLLEGEMIAPDQAEARRWSLAAAEQGVAASMTRLGMIYHNALGVERDARAAADWWRRGAERGDADGQAMLGAACHLGAGIPQDPIVAFVWLLMARSGGSALAERFFAAARSKLTAEELADAERRAAEPLSGARAVIIGTAGHIDHGKTALVRALTGVDTDRLKEEKERGITIDLGFAYLPAPNGSVLGFVDVPGHEKFVRNMLAGATGIDFALLVVAVDDGVMPQTIEHLAIIDLLGIGHGVVALTKADLADLGRRSEVTAQIGQLMSGTRLAGADTVPVSIVTGEGIDALRERLLAASDRFGARAAAGRFRLAVDRSFTLTGAGTVVTGTVLSGAVSLGDRLTVSPSGLAVRIRSIHAQNRAVERGTAGERCALNLAGEGISKDAVARGDVVLDPQLHAPTARIDARLRALASETRPIGQWTPVRLHHAASDVAARVVLLEDPLPPGGEGFVQLVLEKPIAACAGDRFVLRDTTAQRTIGGGSFLDLRAPARKRRTPERLQQLAAHAIADPERALAALLTCPPSYVDLSAFARDRALAAEEMDRIATRLGLIRVAAPGAILALSAETWTRLKRSLVATLEAFHAENPDLSGMGLERLRLQLEPRLPAPTFRTALQSLVYSGDVALDGAWVRLPGHEVRLTANDEALWETVEPLLGGGDRYRPPRVRDIAGLLFEPEPEVRRLLKLLGRTGRVDEIAHDHFFLRETVAEIVGILIEISASGAKGEFTAAELRDRLDNGRKVAIQILEFFDRHGVTLRRGDRRRLNPHRLDLFRTGDEEGRTEPGGESSPVGRPDFKSGRGREPVFGGFDSHSPPPGVRGIS